MSSSTLSKLSLFCLALVSAAASAEAMLPERDLERLNRSPKMDPVLVETLDRDEAPAYVSITFSPPSRQDPAFAGHPAWAKGINPLVFDLVNMASGEMFLEGRSDVQTFRGAMNANALLTLIDHPNILTISPAEQPRPRASRSLARKASCVPSASTACVQGGRFSISVNHGGNTSQVAASSSESAVFLTYSSTNWEIVAKVLNACGVNGRYWVFSAGATSVSYSITFQDHGRGLLVRYPNASCPLSDTSTFIC